MCQKFIFKNIGEKEQLFCVASTFIYNDKIIIIPANIQNNIYVLNYENYELKEIKEVEVIGGITENIIVKKIKRY